MSQPKKWTDEENAIIESAFTRWKSSGESQYSFVKVIRSSLPDRTWEAIRGKLRNLRKRHM